MSYVEAGGVRTWYAEHGAGPPLVLLHGAFTDASEFGATIPALTGRFRVLTPAHLVGHSDGANVALLAALSRPDLVDRLVLISGNFHHAGLLAGLDLDELLASGYLADAYAQVSPDGRDHFPVVAAKILRMVTTEPTLTAGDLAGVAARTLVMVGGDDAISAEHTLQNYRGIRDAELAVVPGTSHALIIEKPDLCNRIIVDFLTTGPVRTFMPIRRA